ncbi:hypothetical protein AALO_G00282380 [Alosa alosa]|uniref:Sec16 Sec23-binding domain-containing protein n=1 Tax=Alosa alosa TaxID=278164 RepID=A0AAV6FJV1_9TELE|nr:hypothetical protein AALO_G00282380 [Alosa alosa]
MDDPTPYPVGLTPRPRVKIITSPKITAVVRANEIPSQQHVVVFEGLREFKGVLKTSSVASHGGEGDAPAQKQSRTHLDEKLSDSCDGVLLEVYQLAMLQREHFLRANNGPHREGIDLSWGLLALLCKRNGMVTDNDIANLLLQKCLDSNEPETCCAFDNLGNGTSNLARLLLAGKTKEAIDQASSQGVWHHAFTLNNLERHGQSDCIMSRFINDLDDLDLLKTYYQVRLGEMPSAASACAEDSCGTWRLHLAIVVAFTEINHLRKMSITKMAETLASNGQAHAAQFCHLVLQLDRENLLNASLHDVVGKWMGLLAEMDKEVPQIHPAASGEHLMDHEERKLSLKCQRMAVDSLRSRSLPVTSEQPPACPEERKAPPSEDQFRQLIGPLLPPPVCVLRVEVQESACQPLPTSTTVKKDSKKKQSKKRSWFRCISCLGSRTKD